MKKVVSLFYAMSDETRLRILSLLARGELCVCQIEAILRLPQSRISRHLTVLRHAGLVSGRREGVWIHYSLADPGDEVHARMVDCLKTCLQEEPQVQADVGRISEYPPIAVKCCTGNGRNSSSRQTARPPQGAAP
jgi:ArsR family transcriptional regulator